MKTPTSSGEPPSDFPRLAVLEAKAARRDERFRTLYDQIPLMVFTLDRAGTTLSVNAFGARELGYEPRMLVGEPVLAVFYPDDRPALIEELRIAAGQPGQVFKSELRKMRKDGSILWVQEALRALREPGGELVLLMVSEDVTDRRQAQRELAEERDKLRAVYSELALAEEGERRRIASGLHDHVGQVLGVAKVKLGQALAAESADEAHAALTEGRRMVDRAIQEIRSLTFELSSPVLHDLGLGPALKDLAERAQLRYGLAFRFSGDARPMPLAEEEALLLYSIIRELMWNAVKHACARQGAVEFTRDRDCLRITVSDDGAGFAADGTVEPPSEGGGLGLFSARQRMEHLGGDLDIDSAPGQGTRIVLTLPLVADKNRGAAQ